MKTSRRTAALLAVLLLALFAVTPAASAAENASYYFAYTDVVAIPVGNGRIVFESDINATETMDKLGTYSIRIFELQTDGSYDEVASYYSDDYPDMMLENHVGKFTTVTYQGVIGREYYAEFALYAEDELGYEYLYMNTYVVTAY